MSYNGGYSFSKEDPLNNIEAFVARAIDRYPELPRKKELYLFKQLRRAKHFNKPRLKAAVTELLILHNLKLVSKIACRYTYRGVDFVELIQEGVFGLYRALEDYDYSTGNKFSTYAWMWILDRIQRAVKNKSDLLTSIHGNSKSKDKLKKEYSRLRFETGDTPTRAALVERTGISTEDLLLHQSQLCKGGMFSLNDRLAADLDRTIEDMLWDRNAELPESKAAKESDYKLLGLELKKYLNPEDVEFITIKFGLVDDVPRSADQMSELYGITALAASKREKKILEKLKQSMDRGVFNTL